MYKRQDKLRTPEYENWIKSTLALTETKKYIGQYVEDRYLNFIDQKLNPRYCGQKIYDATFDAQERNHIREKPFSYYAMFDRKNGQWKFDLRKVTNLQKCLCKEMFDKTINIISRRSGVEERCMSWDNCTTIGPLHWDVAKVFAYEKTDAIKISKKAEDVDMPVLCNMMYNCDLFTNAVLDNDIDQVCNK